MELRQSPLIEALLAERNLARRQAILGCGIPIVALPDSSELSAGRIGGWESFNGTITNVDVRHSNSKADVPQVVVSTSRWSGTRASPGPVRWLLEHHMRLHGYRFSAERWTEHETTIEVDGQPIVGDIVRAGSRWWAARCQRGDIEISIVAFDWNPDSIAVDTVADLDSLLLRSEREFPPVKQSSQRSAPIVVPPELLDRDPLRALVDVDLQHARDHTEWLADGGPPPKFPAYWSTLWQKAVRRFHTLTEQSESEAQQGVSNIIDHLCNLHYNAPWFRQDAELRERAISETLLFGTGLSDQVSSWRAQHAWNRKRGTQHPKTRSEFEAVAAVAGEWSNEWAAWAAHHAKPAE